MKKLLYISLGVGAALTTGAILLYNKYDRIVSILENSQIKVANVKNISYQLDRITLDLYLMLINHTNHSVNTNLVSISRIEIYSKQTQKFIGEAFANINQIHITAARTLNLPALNVVVPVNSILSGLTDIGSYLDINNISFKIHLEVYGKKFVLDA